MLVSYRTRPRNEALPVSPVLPKASWGKSQAYLMFSGLLLGTLWFDVRRLLVFVFD